VEYKRPTGAYPLRYFQKICRICTPFQDALAVEIALDSLKGFGVIGHFELTGSGYPQISAPPSGETMRKTLKSFRDARMCSRSSITMPSLVGLGFHPPPGRPKTFSFCLFVCSHAFERGRFLMIFALDTLNVRHISTSALVHLLT